jgi:hypothetical protein
VSGRPRFRLVLLRDLVDHEEIEPRKVDALVRDFRRTRVVADPIWVDARSGVVLNGHHRVAALRRLGAARAPAWVVDYRSPVVRLERWDVGPPIAKDDVLRRAAEGRLFPPKTTRHFVDADLPPRSTPLDVLLEAPRARVVRGQRASRSPRPRGASGSETT